MLPFAETIITVDSASLIGGLSTAGGIVGAAILAAAKLIVAAAGRVDTTMQRLHEENRKDRDGMLSIMNRQWKQLSRLAHKVGAGPEDDDDSSDDLK